MQSVLSDHINMYTNVWQGNDGSPLLEDTSLNKVLIAAKIFIHIYVCHSCTASPVYKLLLQNYAFYLSVAQSEVNGLKHKCFQHTSLRGHRRFFQLLVQSQQSGLTHIHTAHSSTVGMMAAPNSRILLGGAASQSCENNSKCSLYCFTLYYSVKLVVVGGYLIEQYIVDRSTYSSM